MAPTDAHSEADRLLGPCNDPDCPTGAGAEPQPVTHDQVVDFYVAKGMTRGQAEQHIAEIRRTGALVTPEEVAAKRAELAPFVAEPVPQDDGPVVPSADAAGNTSTRWPTPTA